MVPHYRHIDADTEGSYIWLANAEQIGVVLVVETGRVELPVFSLR